MSILEIVLLVVVLALIGLGGAASLIIYSKNINNKNQINDLLSSLEVQKALMNKKDSIIELLLGENETFENLQNKRKEIERDIINFDSVLNEKSKQKLELEKDIKELENVGRNLELAAKEKEIAQKDTENLMRRQGELTTSCNVLEKNYNDLNKNYNDLVLKETALQKVLSSKEDIEKEISELAAQLESLKNTHKAAVLSLASASQQDKGAATGLLSNYGVDERWNRLVELLEKLKVDYPELKEEFAKIEWSKIYLPAFQKMIKNLKADQPGIYLIRKLDETGTVCYVGKASSSIKERWYQHAKKMLGVEAKGGEWLYSNGVRPDHFSWEVLEFVDGKDGKGIKDLDKKERYWIEFFGCLEVGMNRI